MMLVVIGLCSYGLLHYIHVPKTVDFSPASTPAVVVTNAPVIAPPPMIETPSRPLTLPECLGADNLIDEAVIACRFGNSQKAVNRSNAQGMVSARYMSQYKAQRQIPQPKLAAAQFVESAIVLQWDRTRTYRAEWVVTDNQIDDTSVCRNWRGGSIEHRECRKGAKVYFKEQCKRLAESASRQRYCSAASGFSPLG
ncbi:hypothetical protein [Pseudomonas cannabina]|nr:hypothetical protein [Pseudomonas cannabina]